MFIAKGSYSLKADKLYIFPLSDLHLGSPNCNLKFFNYWEKVFNETTKNKIIYLLGDLIDLASIKIGAFNQDLSGDSQVLKLVELLKPYKKYIRFMCSGNHPLRAKRDYNVDLGKIVADMLNVPYNQSEFFDTLTINKKDFTVYGKHGTRFSKKVTYARNGFQDDTIPIVADMYLQGHNHYCEAWNDSLRTKNGMCRQYYGFTGHFLSYPNSYAHDKTLKRVPEGFLRFQINRDLAVSWEEYNIDEKCRDLMRT